MTGFTNADGSLLVGAQKPGGSGQSLQVDTSGNLLVNMAVGSSSTVTVADATTSANKLAVDATGKIAINNFPALQAINLSQVAGSAHTANNPLFTEDQLRAWILNGQGYSATTGKQTAAAALTAPFSIFNPGGSGKTLLLYSLSYMIGNNSFNTLNLVTTDPAFGSALSITNHRAGVATASVASATYSNSNATPTGITSDTIGSSSNAFTQLFTNGALLVLPAGNGLVFYLNLSGANSWCCSARWIEL